MHIIVIGAGGTGGYFGALLMGQEQGLSLPFNTVIYAALKPYTNGVLSQVQEKIRLL
ncbi:MAG: hypothetical protein ABI406_02860 [Ktedonobacteraceae bacterium]